MATFRGECPKCDNVADFSEFVRERRAARSAQAAARGDFRAMMEYSFQCSSCAGRSDKVIDAQGLLHKWQGDRHVTQKV